MLIFDESVVPLFLQYCVAHHFTMSYKVSYCEGCHQVLICVQFIFLTCVFPTDLLLGFGAYT